jgi:hypothetical protein
MKKHAHVAGEVFATGSASRRHVTITLSLSVALDKALTDKPSRIYPAEMKVEVAAKRRYFCPDVFVTCPKEDRPAELTIRAPITSPTHP